MSTTPQLRRVERILNDWVKDDDLSKDNSLTIDSKIKKQLQDRWKKYGKQLKGFGVEKRRRGDSDKHDRGETLFYATKFMNDGEENIFEHVQKTRDMSVTDDTDIYIWFVLKENTFDNLTIQMLRFFKMKNLEENEESGAETRYEAMIVSPPYQYLESMSLKQFPVPKDDRQTISARIYNEGMIIAHHKDQRFMFYPNGVLSIWCHQKSITQSILDMPEEDTTYNTAWDMNVVEFFLERFQLKEKQSEALRHILSFDARSCFVLLPTGYGKTRIFETAARFFSERLELEPATTKRRGVSIVITPLLALAADQAKALDAVAINSDTLASGYQEAKEQIENGKVRRILFTAETFANTYVDLQIGKTVHDVSASMFHICQMEEGKNYVRKLSFQVDKDNKLVLATPNESTRKRVNDVIMNTTPNSLPLRNYTSVTVDSSKRSPTLDDLNILSTAITLGGTNLAYIETYMPNGSESHLFPLRPTKGELLMRFGMALCAPFKSGPEKDFKRDFLNYMALNTKITMVVIDESHVITAYKGFRDSYRLIGLGIKYLERQNRALRTLALTATATEEVKEDIANVLGMDTTNPKHKDVIASSLNRPNLVFSVIESDRSSSTTNPAYDDRLPLDANLADLKKEPSKRQENSQVQADKKLIKYLKQIVNKAHENKTAMPCGLIFCRTKKETLFVSQRINYEMNLVLKQHQEIWGKHLQPLYTKKNNNEETKVKYDLKSYTIKLSDARFERSNIMLCDFFHGELPRDTKLNIMDRWQKGDVPWIACTNAFGLGIDKPDVRFVVHNTPTATLLDYVQESGRAGRDGLRSECVLIYNKRINEDALQKVDLRGLAGDKRNPITEKNKEVSGEGGKDSDGKKIPQGYGYMGIKGPGKSRMCLRRKLMNAFAVDYKASNPKEDGKTFCGVFNFRVGDQQQTTDFLDPRFRCSLCNNTYAQWNEYGFDEYTGKFDPARAREPVVATDGDAPMSDASFPDDAKEVSDPSGERTITYTSWDTFLHVTRVRENHQTQKETSLCFSAMNQVSTRLIHHQEHINIPVETALWTSYCGMRDPLAFPVVEEEEKPFELEGKMLMGIRSCLLLTTDNRVKALREGEMDDRSLGPMKVTSRDYESDVYIPVYSRNRNDFALGFPSGQSSLLVGKDLFCSALISNSKSKKKKSVMIADKHKLLPIVIYFKNDKDHNRFHNFLGFNNVDSHYTMQREALGLGADTIEHNPLVSPHISGGLLRMNEGDGVSAKFEFLKKAKDKLKLDVNAVLRETFDKPWDTLFFLKAFAYSLPWPPTDPNAKEDLKNLELWLNGSKERSRVRKIKLPPNPSDGVVQDVTFDLPQSLTYEFVQRSKWAYLNTYTAGTILKPNQFFCKNSEGSVINPAKLFGKTLIGDAYITIVVKGKDRNEEKRIRVVKDRYAEDRIGGAVGYPRVTEHLADKIEYMRHQMEISALHMDARYKNNELKNVFQHPAYPHREDIEWIGLESNESGYSTMPFHIALLMEEKYYYSTTNSHGLPLHHIDTPAKDRVQDYALFLEPTPGPKPKSRVTRMNNDQEWNQNRFSDAIRIHLFQVDGQGKLRKLRISDKHKFLITNATGRTFRYELTVDKDAGGKLQAGAGIKLPDEDGGIQLFLPDPTKIFHVGIPFVKDGARDTNTIDYNNIKKGWRLVEMTREEKVVKLKIRTPFDVNIPVSIKPLFGDGDVQEDNTIEPDEIFIDGVAYDQAGLLEKFSFTLDDGTEVTDYLGMSDLEVEFYIPTAIQEYPDTVSPWLGFQLSKVGRKGDKVNIFFTVPNDQLRDEDIEQVGRTVGSHVATFFCAVPSPLDIEEYDEPNEYILLLPKGVTPFKRIVRDSTLKFVKEQVRKMPFYSEEEKKQLVALNDNVALLEQEIKEAKKTVGATVNVINTLGKENNGTTPGQEYNDGISSAYLREDTFIELASPSPQQVYVENIERYETIRKSSRGGNTDPVQGIWVDKTTSPNPEGVEQDAHEIVVTLTWTLNGVMTPPDKIFVWIESTGRNDIYQTKYELARDTDALTYRGYVRLFDLDNAEEDDDDDEEDEDDEEDDEKVRYDDDMDAEFKPDEDDENDDEEDSEDLDSEDLDSEDLDSEDGEDLDVEDLDSEDEDQEYEP